MNYIIFDLEFNQAYNSQIEIKCPFEIIQIGAIKLNENFTTIDTFNALVKPEIYSDLNPFVKNLTNLTMDSLNKAKPFREVYKDFLKFLNKDKNIFCIWGMADMKELFRNIVYYELDTEPIPKEYINVQAYTGIYLNYPKSVNIGLSIAVELFHITKNNDFHNAFNDAFYTAEVFKKIYSEKIKTKIYKPMNNTTTCRHKNTKTKIDTVNLFKQFEKMFNTKLTLQEEDMIKLAYMMGKTNQFQIKSHNKTKKE
ncbi:TPA: exonuclease domain-containing protein [Clostridium botulinum]|uniref:3'-5' exonuclease n=1 Tax=Clostridium TaxID=1485 RepID=UPI000774881E|nr:MULTISPECIES: 3'-5' exonuclease [Clostridium]AUM96096.1 exonuclease [Clostridium sporogenes]AVQ53545.1 exonuclease [Clostridium botulinum]MCW6110316.1 exonuclease domain-containing protein [Clostridium sporogenes]HBJ2614210.1 exonuclease domain-containing protein [Clostridium botulinum]